MTKKIDLQPMTVDELWKLHEELTSLLSARMTSEKRQLEKRLAQLRREEEATVPGASYETARSAPRIRRAYPRVVPKYRNPDNPDETWSGRGKRPRWMAAALDGGRDMDDMLIVNKSKAAEAADNGHRR